MSLVWRFAGFGFLVASIWTGEDTSWIDWAIVCMVHAHEAEGHK